MSGNIEPTPAQEPGDNVEVGQEIKPLQFIIGGNAEDTDHSGCAPDSPCQRPDEFRSIKKSLGIRGMEADGEIWLSRMDVLALLAETFEAYHSLSHEFQDKASNGDEEARATAFSAFISAQTVNMIGAQLHRMTQPENAINLSVPDTVPTDWLSETPTGQPAAESPIETAIRKAKEAALEAQKAKEDGK